MSAAPDHSLALRRFARDMSDLIESDAPPHAKELARRLERSAIDAIVTLDMPANILAFTAPDEVVEAGRAFVAAVAANFPDCPECHGGNTFATDVETREVVDGELVVTPVKAWDCGDCHYAWIPEEA